MTHPATRQSLAPEGAYAFVESLHLRQWCQRVVAPIAVLATNAVASAPDGAHGSTVGFLSTTRLPSRDLPLRFLELSPDDAQTVRIGLTVSALVTVGLAAWLRVAAKGVLVRKSTVTTEGVYAVVRHPYYLANLLGGFGILAFASPLGAALGIVWLVVALPVFLITMRGEERGLGAIHGAAWSDYAKSAPRLLPRLVPSGIVKIARAIGTPITWNCLVAENEPPRLLRFLAALGVVAAFRLGQSGGAAAAVGALSLWAGSFALQAAIRRPR